MTTVVVAEKPSVARDLARVLGRGAGQSGDGFIQVGNMTFTWCIGHLVEQCAPDDYLEEWKSWSFSALPMIPDKFKTKPTKNGRKQLSVIKKLVKPGVEVVNACDAGREGELIFWMAMRQNGWGRDLRAGEPGPGNVSRMWLDSMTDGAIQTAWSGRKPISTPKYRQLAESAYARSEADWLLGMNLTRATSVSFKKPAGVKVWSVGRVQTPVLAAIVNRDRRIAEFKPDPFWSISATFGANQSYTAMVTVPKGFDRLGKDDRFAKEDQARLVEASIKAHLEAIWKVEDKSRPTKEKPPRLFSLTSLQQHCSRVKGWTAKRTLAAAQVAYEQDKSLTYPRTDAEYLPDDYCPTSDTAMKSLAGWTNKQGLSKLPTPSTSQQQQNFNSKKVTDHFAIVPTGVMPKNLTGDAGEIWAIVASRFVIAFGDTAEATKVSRQLSSLIDGRDLLARCAGKSYQKKGWIEAAEKLTRHRSKETILPESGPSDQAKGTSLKSGKTEPPNPYREDTLLAMMEDVTRMDGAVIGDSELREAMKEHGLGTPATRAAIIETLIGRSFVARRKKDLIATSAGSSLIGYLQKRKLDALTEPKLTAVWEKRLQSIEGGGDSHNSFIADLTDELRGLILHLKADAAKIAAGGGGSGLSSGIELAVLCPKSGKPMIEFEKFYRAPGYPKAALWKTVAQRPMSPDEYRQLLGGEDLGVLTGFKSKKNKPFKARLAWASRKNKLEFEFS